MSPKAESRKRNRSAKVAVAMDLIRAAGKHGISYVEMCDQVRDHDARWKWMGPHAMGHYLKGFVRDGTLIRESKRIGGTIQTIYYLAEALEVGSYTWRPDGTPSAEAESETYGNQDSGND